MNTPELSTERLRLKRISRDDIQNIFECWMQDEDVSRYMCWKSSKDIQKTYEFVDFEMGNISSDFWYRWLIENKETGELIGTGMFYFNDDEDNWDISYNLGKKYWGNGYITEAMTANVFSEDIQQSSAAGMKGFGGNFSEYWNMDQIK